MVTYYGVIYKAAQETLGRVSACLVRRVLVGHACLVRVVWLGAIGPAWLTMCGWPCLAAEASWPMQLKLGRKGSAGRVILEARLGGQGLETEV